MTNLHTFTIVVVAIFTVCLIWQHAQMHSLKFTRDHPTSTTAKAGACALVATNTKLLLRLSKQDINDNAKMKQPRQKLTQCLRALEAGGSRGSCPPPKLLTRGVHCFPNSTGARVLCGTLSKMRSGENFAAIYEKAELAMQKLQLKPPKLESLHRHRQTPARFESTSNPSAAREISTHAERIRMQYFEALDILIAAVNERFSQPGIDQLLEVEKLILLSANDYNNEASLNTVLGMYDQDFEKKW